MLTYARHAQIGRVHYSRVSADIVYDLVAPEPGAVLTKLADAKNVAEALDSYNPPHPGYKALKAKLAEARGRTGDTGRARISPGQSLKAGMEDPRVPLLRDRLGVDRRGRQHHLRQGAGRGGEEIPAPARPVADRRSEQRDRRCASTARAATATPTSSSPTWNGGGGCRAISATPM